MRPFLFLDIDGVLNHAGSQWIDQGNLDCLARIVSAVDPEIVLTSSWRTEMRSRRMREFMSTMACNGISINFRTDDLGSRSKEIQKFIDEHDIKCFAILDDENYYEKTPLLEYVFFSDYYQGLTLEIAYNVVKYLKACQQ